MLALGILPLPHLISPKPLTRQTFLIGAFFFVLLLEVAFEETTLSPSTLLAVLNESTDGQPVCTEMSKNSKDRLRDPTL